MANPSPLAGSSSCISLAITIAILILTINIFRYTSENPFNKHLEPNDHWYNFFGNEFQAESSVFKKQCKCGEEIVNDFCNEEQILSGCVDITANPLKNNKQFLRYLGMETNECTNYISKIKNLKDDETLNSVFTLNFDYIHKMALGLLILVIIGFAIIILLFIAGCGSLCFGDCAYLCLVPCLPCFILFILLGNLVNLVLFIILSVNYFKGDTSTYVDFLGCSGVKREKFNSYFEDVENLKGVFIPYFILNIIYLVASCCSGAANKGDSS